MTKELICKASDKTKKEILIFGGTFICIFTILAFEFTEDYIASFFILLPIVYLLSIFIDIYYRKIIISKDRKLITFIKPLKRKIILISDIKEWGIITKKIRDKMFTRYLYIFKCVHEKNKTFAFNMNFPYKKKDILEFFSLSLPDEKKKVYPTLKEGNLILLLEMIFVLVLLIIYIIWITHPI